METWEDRPTEIEIIEETLTDSSRVYGVKIRQYENEIQVDCRDREDAEKLQNELLELMDKYTVNEYRGI